MTRRQAISVVKVAALLLALCVATAAQAGTFSATTASGQPGTSVNIELRFAGEGSTVDAQADIVYDATALTPTLSPQTGSCAVIVPGRIRVLTTSAETGAKPAGATNYCSVMFAIAPGTPAPSTRLLTFQSIVCSDANSGIVACNGVAGQVNVLSNVVPEFSATPSPGSTISINTPAGAVGGSSISISNTGTGTLTVTSCSLGSGFSTPASFPLHISPSGNGSLGVQCVGPAAGSTFSGSLTCFTNDADEGTVFWPLACTSPAPAAPEVTAAPPSGTTITLNGPLNGFVTSNVTLDNFAGSANLTATCVTSGSTRFAVTPVGLQSISPATSRTFVVSCNLPPSPGATISGLLTCSTNDTSEPTLSFPLSCLTPPGPSYGSLPAPGTVFSLSAASGQFFLSRKIAVSNVGSSGTTLSVTGCAMIGATELSVTPGSLSILQGTPAKELAVGCAVPDTPSTTVRGDLICNTNDPTRPQVGYPIVCTSPPNGVKTSVTQVDSLTLVDDVSQDALFGTSIAATDTDSSTVIVAGAPFGGEDGGGRAYIFDSSSAPVPTAAELKAAPDGAIPLFTRVKAVAVVAAPQGIPGDMFGQSVAITPNGEVIAVGAPFRGPSGEVHLFRKPLAGSWGALAQPFQILSGASQAGVVPGGFGRQVSFADDGRLIVGAPDASVAGLTGAGAAYAFAAGSLEFDSSSILTASEPQAGAAFGSALAAIANRIAIGAPQHDFTPGGDEGAAFVFTIAAGTIGPPSLLAPLPQGIGDRFGSGVAIGSGILVAGSPFATTPSGTDSGSATVFTPGPFGSLVQRATLLPMPGTAQGAGSAVGVNADTIVVGAPLATVNGKAQQGRAYLYEIDELLTPAVVASRALENIVGAQDDHFGAAIVLRQGQLLIGVPRDDDDVAGPASANEGRVDPYVLDRVFAGGFE